MQQLTVAPHPLLDLCAFVTTFPRALGELPSPPELLAGRSRLRTLMEAAGECMVSKIIGIPPFNH